MVELSYLPRFSFSIWST